MGFCFVIAHLCVGAPDEPMRILGRGARAWENVAGGDRLGEAHPDVTRLLAHAGADTTEVVYLKKVEEILLRWIEKGIRHLSYAELDQLLAKEFDRMCYVEYRSPGFGSATFNGFIGTLPEINGLLPRSNRALKSWLRLQPGREGVPICEEGVMMCAKRLFEEGRLQEGVIVLLSFDGYLRSQDWAQVCGCDITFDGRSVALVFGVGARGMTVKTGQYQGVVVSRGWIAELLLVLVSRCDPHAAVFSLTQDRFRKTFQAFWASVGHSWVRAVHWLRHSGAAGDLECGRRDLEGVRKRGRWKHVSACHRYTKTHLVVECRHRLGAELCLEGRNFMLAPRENVCRAFERGPGRHSSLGKALIARMRAGPRLPDTEGSVRPGTSSPRLPPVQDPMLLPPAQIQSHLRQNGEKPPCSKRAARRKFSDLQAVPVFEDLGSLDSDDETICASEYDNNFADISEVSEVEEEGQLARLRQGCRRRRQKTAQNNAS